MIHAETILDSSLAKAWERALIFCAGGPSIAFGGGNEIKHAHDSQVTIILTKTAVQDALNEQYHPSDPWCTPARLTEYKNEYQLGIGNMDFDYTYVDRLERGFNVSQVDVLREGLKLQIEEELSSNRNIAILYNPEIDTNSRLSKPCWNEIMVRLEGPWWASVHTTFRSHDISAWNANICAMSEFVYENIVEPCGCNIAMWAEHNYSLHIYDYDLPLLDKLQIVSRNPMTAYR